MNQQKMETRSKRLLPGRDRSTSGKQVDDDPDKGNEQPEHEELEAQDSNQQEVEAQGGDQADE